MSLICIEEYGLYTVFMDFFPYHALRIHGGRLRLLRAPPRLPHRRDDLLIGRGRVQRPRSRALELGEGGAELVLLGAEGLGVGGGVVHALQIRVWKHRINTRITILMICEFTEIKKRVQDY